MNSPPSQATGRLDRIRSRLRGFLVRRGRTWVLMVPLHLVAFFALYLGTIRLVETEIINVARDAASQRLGFATRELYEIATAHPPNQRRTGHAFSSLLASYRGVNLQLFLPGGAFVGPQVDLSPQLHREIQEFFQAPDMDRVWLASSGDARTVRGLRRIVATRPCLSCHRSGETLAVASISSDLTAVLARSRDHSRRSLALLILAWTVALFGTTALVRLSVERSAARLRADLAAAESGVGRPGGRDSDFVLDPATADLHRSLREFLSRQRQRQEEFTTRLVHTDQLASLGQLAAGLAHEIKNPLAGIQGALEILRQDADQESITQLYDEMLSELKRVNQTLHTMLSSARPAPPRLAATDLRELLADVHRLMEPGLRRRRISLAIEAAVEPLEAQVDGAKIRQVLINLIQNAAEALEPGGHIRVRAGDFMEGGLVIAVEDDGPGIPEEQLQKIFDPFFTTKFSGTGLGLAISRSLVEQHGGSLEVDSEAGRGSTFYLILPATADKSRRHAVTAD